MSKNELNVIARIVLVGVGIYVILQTLSSVFSIMVAMPMLASAGVEKMPMAVISLGIYAIITIAAVYFLFRCAKRISSKIVGPEPADETQVSWLAVAFRLMCVSVGVLFIYWSLPNLIVTLSMFMNNKSGQPGQQYIYMSSKPDIIRYVIMLILSIYFALGAPGFVRWQVKRTLKQCSKFEEQKPPWG